MHSPSDNGGDIVFDTTTHVRPCYTYAYVHIHLGVFHISMYVHVCIVVCVFTCAHTLEYMEKYVECDNGVS